MVMCHVEVLQLPRWKHQTTVSLQQVRRGGGNGKLVRGWHIGRGWHFTSWGGKQGAEQSKDLVQPERWGAATKFMPQTQSYSLSAVSLYTQHGVVWPLVHPHSHKNKWEGDFSKVSFKNWRSKHIIAWGMKRGFTFGVVEDVVAPVGADQFACATLEEHQGRDRLHLKLLRQLRLQR